MTQEASAAHPIKTKTATPSK